MRQHLRLPIGNYLNCCNGDVKAYLKMLKEEDDKIQVLDRKPASNAATPVDPSRWEISTFSLLLFYQMRDSSAFSVCILFEESVFIFQFLNAQLYQTKHNCEFHH